MRTINNGQDAVNNEQRTTNNEDEVVNDEQLTVDNEGEGRSEAEEWKDRALRVQAEYTNYRTRTQRDLERSWGGARADTLAQLLPVLDNLERAAEAPCSDETYKQGLELTLRQFVELLTKLGVSEIDAFEKPFDPQWMEAVLHEESETLGENTVSEVFTKGYRMGDRVLRCAIVKVVN